MFARQSFVALVVSLDTTDAAADPAVGTSSARTKKNVAAQNAVIRPILLFTAVANTTGAAGAAGGAGHTLV